MKAKRGSSTHLRRSLSPDFWPIPRKRYVWTIKPSPGPHPSDVSVPLGILLRDALRYAYTLREARKILGEKRVYVDGRVVSEYKYPIGVMDVILLADAEEYYRVLPHPTKFLMLHRIDEKESSLKPLRVKRKVTVKNGYIQFTFHDGKTFILKNTQTNMFSKFNNIKTFDTVLMNLETKSLIDHLPVANGVLAYIINGRNIGFLGKIESIQQIFKRRAAITTLTGSGGVITRTILDYIFVVGREKPLISIPTDDEIRQWNDLLSKQRML
ncbi:MAG: 30S ribosomal protein S4e [Thermofilaceae archaeon]|nr:30S ribosomal protein S4e [Thermofilaceae archaeon]MCX8180625.1 30S ribosomal protein S4e [Thermofilaceae archaeon]MDW8003727.1 30S ribosomal protein S4e [Thermofilaceae archaeon]